MRRSPKVITRNSATAAKDNVVVYWASPKGEIMLAPDTRITEAQMRRMPEYKHWRRCEAVGAREIEKISLILSRQLFEKKKQMKVEQHLREKFALDQLQFRCKLRLAQAYSKNDEEMNNRILQKAKRSEEAMYRVIASEFIPETRTSSLEMEAKPQSTSRSAHIGQKPVGIQ
jgi:hypothetical protein